LKTAKLVTGILSIVMTVIIMLQSCAAGLLNTLDGSDEVSGAAGFIVAILMIAGGITMISTRKSERRGGSIAASIIFGVAALLGFSLAGSFGDLKVWSTWCVLMLIFSIISIITNK